MLREEKDEREGWSWDEEETWAMMGVRVDAGEVEKRVH